jgi:hypothetical protein
MIEAFQEEAMRPSRLRTLMLAVAALALALWAGLMASRSATYCDIAARHAAEAASLEDCAGYAEPGGIVRRRADHHARLRDKYLRASRRPWLILDDDPPVPDYPR